MCIFPSSPEKSDARRRRRIQKNNRKVEASPPALLGEELLVLVPHCLQWSECPHKITHQVDNCRRCGKCVISSLLTLREKYRFSLRVAKAEALPRLIRTHAAKRGSGPGLASGTWKAASGKSVPSPSTGSNLPGRHPCFNTQVSLDKVEKALAVMLR
jgi:hypothetical protein